MVLEADIGGAAVVLEMIFVVTLMLLAEGPVQSL
jgi:hypothetical protein